MKMVVTRADGGYLEGLKRRISSYNFEKSTVLDENERKDIVRITSI